MTFLKEAKTIAVTGHRGFLGRHLVEELINGGVSTANIRRVSRETGYDLTKPDDAARGLVLAGEVYNDPEPINLGSGVKVTMRQLAENIAVLTRYTGSIGFDTSKPNGQPKRILDITRAREKLGYAPQEDFDAGLAETVEYYEREVLPNAK